MAITLALGEAAATPPDRPRQPPRPAGAPLTGGSGRSPPLVAEGLTDREIAARLVISPRTAESHVEQILTRLGFRSRAQIAAWVSANPPMAMPQPRTRHRSHGPADGNPST